MTTKRERTWDDNIQELSHESWINGNLSLLETFGCINREHNYHSRQHVMHKRGGEEDKSVGKQILTINSEVTHVLCMYVRRYVCR